MNNVDFNALSNPVQAYENLTGVMTEAEKSLVTVGFYIISNKTFTVRKIVIEDFKSVEGLSKLQRWTEQRRLIATIEKGSEVFAFTSAETSEKLKEKDFAIEGKTVTLKTLNNSEYDSIITMNDLVKIFLESQTEHDFHQADSKELYKDKDLKVVGNHKDSSLHRKFEAWISKIKQTILTKWGEDIREQARLRKEEDKRHWILKKQIEAKYLNERILNEKVNKEVIESEQIRRSVK